MPLSTGSHAEATRYMTPQSDMRTGSRQCRIWTAVGGAIQAFHHGGWLGGKHCQTTGAIALFAVVLARSLNINATSAKALEVGQ